MHFKNKLKTEIPKDRIPGSYQVIGDVLLLKFLKIKSIKEKKKIASALMEMLPYIKTVCEIGDVKGELRRPKVNKILGKGTETVHKEHGIKYKLDAAKIMFSKGNVSERKRLVSEVEKNETIIDMFAGIGYFSLGLSKQAKKIYAIEKNKKAFHYLKENILLNKIKNIEPIHGDCRKIKIKEKADRVIMGYFPGTERFLNSALRLVKKGGIIHFHNTYATHELWLKPEADLKKHVKDFEIIEKRIVKSAGPHIQHVVLDVKVL